MKTSKLCMLLGILMLCISLAACSDDDDNSSPQDLIGTWELTSTEEWYMDETGRREDLVDDGFDQTYLVFNEDGCTGVQWQHEIYNGREKWYDDYFSWEVKNGKLYTRYDEDDGDYGLSFSVSSSTLTIQMHEKAGKEEYYLKNVYIRSTRTEFE